MTGVLPDYQRLKLNTTGAQQWNPPIYDILTQLIDAVQQSQDVLSNNQTVPEGVFTTVTEVINAGQLKSAFSVPIVIVPAMAGEIVVPLYYFFHSKFKAINNVTSTAHLSYRGSASGSYIDVNAIAWTARTTTLDSTMFDYCFKFSVALGQIFNYTGDIILFGDSDATGDSSNLNQLTCSLTYYTLPATIMQ